MESCLGIYQNIVIRACAMRLRGLDASDRRLWMGGLVLVWGSW